MSVSARLAVALLGVALLVLAAAACRAPEPDLAEGVWLAGDAAVLGELFDELRAFDGSPLARWADALATRTAPCDEVLAHLSPGAADDTTAGSFAEAVGCRSDEEMPVLDALRGSAAAVVVASLPKGRLLVRLDRLAGGSGGWSLGAELGADALEGTAAQLLPAPAGRTAGPAVLADGDGVLFHGRFAADQGLDLGAGVASQSSADRLFRLKSQVFSSLILSGVWEVAMYEPSPGEEMPPIALAAEHNGRSAATAAMESFLDEMASVWSLVPSPVTVGELSGACYEDLRLLPALAPCYVVDDRALVLAWNVDSLRRALDGAGADLGEESRLVAHFDRFSRSEELLLETLRPVGPRTPPAVYPWRRLDASGRRDGERYLLTVRLER